jgi:hypothetical protein
MKESDLEDILAKYPEVIEEDLKLIGRQVSLFGRRMDLLFEDGFKRRLIIELKNGPIKDEHIGQIISYEGLILSADDPTVRVMLIGTRVPPNLRKSLDHHGIAWKEISNLYLKEFLKSKGDDKLLKLFEENMTEQKSVIASSYSVGKKEDVKKESEIDRITSINVTQTPIKELLKNEISDDNIRYMSKFPSFISSGIYSDKKLLHKIHEVFYETVRKLAAKISGNEAYEKAQEIRPLNKYETCVISGIREMQRELGIRPNLNHVKYKEVKKLISKKA